MADPQTTNLQLFTPANGADPGVWDVPVNANWNQLEAVLTGSNTVTLNNSPVTLSAGQYNNSFLTFSGNLTANVTVTFPVIARTWTIFNNCGSNVSFTVTCQTSISTIFVAAPPGEPIQIFSDGTNIRFMGLGRVGQYLDVASSSIPLWITASTPAPYLNCDGTTFSSATYPALRDYLGSNTLPDSKGRFRAALDQSAGRLTGAAANNGLDGTTFLAGGGAQLITVTNLPNYLLGDQANFGTKQGVLGGGPVGVAAGGSFNVSNYLGGNHLTLGGFSNAYAPPSYVGGLTLVRAG